MTEYVKVDCSAANKFINEERAAQPQAKGAKNTTRGISLIFMYPVAAVTHVIVLAFKESHSSVHNRVAWRVCATQGSHRASRRIVPTFAYQMSQINLNIRD